MTMIFDYQLALSTLMQAGYTLRYELTCGILLVVLWCMGQIAGWNQKTKNSKSAHLPVVGKKWIPGDDINTQSRSPAPISASQLARMDTIDRKLLRDSAWLMHQVTNLCRAQVQQALMLYRSAVKVGLQLQDVPKEHGQQLFGALVTSAIRIGQVDDAMQLLRELRVAGVDVFPSLFSSVVKICTSKHLFRECLAFYDFMCEDRNFSLTDKSLWSCLLFSAIEVRAYHRCINFFERLQACGIPSQKDFGNMIRFASLHGDWQLSLQLVKNMRQSNTDVDCVIYNTALATCVSADKMEQAKNLLTDMESTEGIADIITYNTVMKGYAKAGLMEQCCELFNSLKARNIKPSQVTYGILLDGLINGNQLEKAAEVFNAMSKDGCTMNTVLFTTFMKGFARAGEVDQAMKVYEQMRTVHNTPPDLITFSILIKANCDADRLETALQLLESMLQMRLRPDEVIFNNLLTGCAKQSNAELGKRLYADMVASGIRPSNATFSILIRVYHQCKLLDEAVEMLRTEPSKNKVDPEPRLYLQLIQACIRERQGRRAVEVYEMMLAHSLPAASSHGSIIGTCIKLNMYETAAEILDIAAAKGGRVDMADANALLQGAVRKQKSQLAHDIMASMTKLGIQIDPKLMAAVAPSRAVKVKA